MPVETSGQCLGFCYDAVERAQGKRLGRPPASPILLHAARDLVVAGVPVAEAARRKGVARSTLQRFMRGPEPE